MNRTDRTYSSIHYPTYANVESLASEVFLSPSFGAPLVLLWAPYGESEDARYIHGGFSEPSRKCHGALTEVYALGNIGGVANEAGFNGSRTYVHEKRINK